MRYPRHGEPIVPRLLRALVIDRRPGSLTDPDLELLSRFDLGPEAWSLLSAEVCQRVSMLVVDRVQTRVDALPEQTRKIRLPDPEAALKLPIERRTANTLRREARRGAGGPWTVGRYLGLRRFGGRALVDLLAAIESSGAAALEPIEPAIPAADGEMMSERALDASLALVGRHLPISEERAQQELIRAGLSSGPVDLGELAHVAVRLGRNAPFHIIDVGGTRMIVRLADVTAARASYRIALRTVQGWGTATIRAVASQVRAAVHAVVEASFVEQMLIGISAFRWLDRRDGWFWFAQRRNPILTDVCKVFSVATRLPFLRLWDALFRTRPGPPPSAEAIRQICDAIPGAHLSDDVVTVDRAFDRAAHLTSAENQVARMIETSAVGVSDSQLRKMAHGVGLPWTTVWRLLRSSPVFERAPTGLYVLIGSAG
jgi:hypothetical protein